MAERKPRNITFSEEEKKKLMKEPIYGTNLNYPKCPVCAYGFSEVVRREAERGSSYDVIKRKMKEARPLLYKASQVKRKHIQNHIFSKHDLELRADKVVIMRKARRDYVKNKKSIEEIGENMMTYVSNALDLVQDISKEETDKMSAKEKFTVANQASKIIQKGQEIALKARSEQLNENKFLLEIGKLASGSPKEYLNETND